MCSRTTCRKCKKPTWSGCGQHIEQALAGVPKNQRCSCATGSEKANSTKLKTGGFFSKLLGK
jgi:hypothetical protein